MSDETLAEETVTDFTEAPAVPEDPTAGTEAETASTTESGEGANAEATTSKGRPRDEATIQRDESVVKALGEGPATRDELATKLDIAGNLVYLSLWRLRKADKVIKLNGKTWALPGTVLPEPAPKATEAPAAEAEAEAEAPTAS